MNNRPKFFWLLTLLAVGISCGKDGGGGSNPTPTPTPQPPITVSTFTNPLLSSGPDPWVIKKDDQYYYTHTLGNRIALWKTRKMTELKNAIPQTIWAAPVSGVNSRNVWAPELHFVDNKWYVYYTAGSSGDHATQRMFVLENTSADPLSGTWTDRGMVRDAAADFFAIDATVLTHGGKNYLLWSGHASATDNAQRIYIARLSNPWTLETARVLISSPQFSWETVGAPPAVNEGPEVLKNAAGRVFVAYSASGCWTDDYALGLLALREGGDPLNAADWTKSPSPVFSKNPAGNAYGPGHNAFFKSSDGTEDWILYHANPNANQGCADFRNPRIQKFTWNTDGTPNFGTPTPLSTPIVKPAGE